MTLFSILSPISTLNMWFGKSKTIEKTYRAGGINFICDSVLYYYDSALLGKHSFLTRKRSFNSDLTETVETYKYAEDFTPSTNFIKRMRDNHIVNEPIEYVRKVNASIVAAYYKKYISGQSREVYECDFSKYPTSSTGIDSYGNLLPGTYYEKRYCLNVDASGNLLSIVKDAVIQTSFIHGYNNALPVVALDNINYNQINPSILSSIQNHAFSGSGRISDITTDIDYIKSTLDSLYYENKSHITIYTYKPLVGLTSVTNPGGTTIFYEYDVSGRLQYIKDHNGKIIEQYDYHYKQ